MSLYGTGRSEGIGAAAAIAGFVLLVHWLGAGNSAVMAPAGQRLLFAAMPALGGALCYRFLRAQGRSRYAAFLAGAAYGSSPWLAAMAVAPRELIAAALVPLALEAACRYDRPSLRRTWLPWIWVCMAAPFLAGSSVIAWLGAGLCLLALVRTAACGDRDASLPSTRLLVWTVCSAAMAAGQLIWLDPLSPWLGCPVSPSSHDVLTMHRTATGLDIAAALRVGGPLLLLFAGLGLLRRQRHVDTATWLAVIAAGALPTGLAAVPFLAHATPLLAAVPALAATAWWLSLFGLVVLATAGLDDFLDLPLRRRTALPWLLALSVLAAALLPAIGTRAPEREWPLTLALPALAALLLAWRRLGILQLKNVLAIAALVSVSLPLLQTLPSLRARTAALATTLPAAPLEEVLATAAFAAQPQPLEPYVGLLAALAMTALLAGVDRVRLARLVPAVAPRRGAALKGQRARS